MKSVEKITLGAIAAAVAVAPYRRQHRIGCAIVRRDGAIVASRNAPARNKEPQCHAEARALRKAGSDARFVMIVRVKRDGSLGMAMPCKNCQNLLRARRAKRVVYTDTSGRLKTLW